MIETTTIKHCPFCNALPMTCHDWLTDPNGHTVNIWAVSCPNSTCPLGNADTSYYYYLDEAVSHWNKRPEATEEEKHRW